MTNIDLIREVKRSAVNHWGSVLPACGVDVPERGKHGACPVCGGTDRFHFIDDHHNGNWFCRQCDAPNHGDGLDLIAKVKGISVLDAAKEVSQALSLPLPEPARQEAPKSAAPPIAEKVRKLVAQTTTGQSAYLTAKGHTCPVRLLDDGSLLLVIRRGDEVTGAQIIRPDGEKRLIAGTRKKGSYIPVSELPETTDTVLIAEGYATALTVAQLHDGLVLAAIDEGNLLPVTEWAASRYPEAKIIIAADNDIKPGQPNVGKISAEKAVKSFHRGWVTLPPTEDKADWDDYRQQYGTEAAKQAFSKGLYQVNAGEADMTSSVVIKLDDHRAKEKNADLKPFFDKRHGGLYYVERKQNNNTGEIDEQETWVADEIETVGIGSDGKDGYLVVQMKQEGSGKTIFEAIPRREIGSPQGWGRLRSRGVNITTKRGHLDSLAVYLQRQGNRDEWTITHTAGWHDGAYVMPDGHIIGTPSRPVAFCGGTSAVSGYIVRGTAGSWRDNVASLMTGNQSMILGGLVALAAPLNSLAGGSSFGIHLFAQSSAGKTTTVEAASSIYGVPDELKLTWDATKYGLTIEAASRNDGFMPIDEIGQGNDVKHVAGSAYSLFNGTGRIQGNKDGGNRAVLRWTIVALSTGEEDFETYLLRNGVTPKAGQLVRLVSVPFTDTVEFHSLDDGDLHSRTIKRVSTQHCGAAGRAWIAYLANNQDCASQKVIQKEKEWLEGLPGEVSPQVKRVATRFAMLDATAELSAGITGWDQAECNRFIRNSFNEWLENYGTGSREKYQVVKRARDFIQRYGLNRFQPYTFGKRNGDLDRIHAGRISDLAGYLVSGRREDGQDEYHIIPSVFEDEILMGIQKKLGAEALEEAGLLVRPEPGRVDGKTISVNGSQQRFIVLVDSEDD
ncbi:DUF927 domain-containing protein [Morganella psychrotolerans]|uniref:DUF927 domain-containing protein n=1 Tax=Morganella psychrotolerans TaxID=368603 RepID=UPI0039AFE1B4